MPTASLQYKIPHMEDAKYPFPFRFNFWKLHTAGLSISNKFSSEFLPRKRTNMLSTLEEQTHSIDKCLNDPFIYLH